MGCQSGCYSLHGGNCCCCCVVQVWQNVLRLMEYEDEWVKAKDVKGKPRQQQVGSGPRYPTWRAWVGCPVMPQLQRQRKGTPWSGLQTKRCQPHAIPQRLPAQAQCVLKPAPMRRRRVA